jgi:NitT/TauT family transport system substrate-binding protein
MRVKRCGACAFVVLLISISQAAWSQEGSGLKRTRIGMPNRGARTLGLTAAQTQGFFRAQGLYAELIVVRPSSSLQMLMSGDLDFSTVLASGARAAVGGLPFRIVMTLTVGQDFSLVVRPEIRRVEDLKGKTLAVSGVGEFTDIGARLVLKKYGLTPDRDVKIRPLFGNHPLRLRALQGRVRETLGQGIRRP